MLSAGARNEDLTVGAGLLPVGVCCKELGTDIHIPWFSDVSAMLRCCILPAITTLKVIIRHSVEFVLFFLTSLCLMVKIRVYIHTDLGTSSGCFWALHVAVCCVALRSGSTSPLSLFFFPSFFACELRSEHC